MKTIKTISLFFLIFFVISAAGFSQVLDVPECEQEQTMWCWAGTSQAVLYYYGSDIEQCDIAEYTRVNADWHDFGAVYCCLDPTQGCNYANYIYGETGSIEMILYDLVDPAIETYGFYGTLSETEVADEIAGNRPFIIRVCCPGSGHFIVIRGYVDGVVYYMDPWFGEGYGFGDYGSRVNGQRWKHTLVNTTSPSN
ncbi:MAG: C39 family peptidase [Candidatus Aminicenantes bacterium]|nr:C39 family peptidase [Candidatus Aminicenantes bacterium]